MGEPSNNPMLLEQYNSISPTDIRSGGYTIQNLITKQLERIDFMLTLGTAKIGDHSYFEEDQMIAAVHRGLRTIESYLSPYIEEDTEYKEKSNNYKTIIRTALTERQTKGKAIPLPYNTIADWQDLLISRLGNVDLLPQKRTEIEFD